MPRQSIKITDAQTIQLCKEIYELGNSLNTKQHEIIAKARKDIQDYVMETNKVITEDMERLRFALSLPKLDNAEICVDFIEHGLAFVVHGDFPVREAHGSFLDMLDKAFSNEH